MSLIRSANRFALPSPDLVVRLTAAVVVLAAAGLKWYQLAIDSSAMRWPLWRVAVIGVEVALTGWLLIGMWPRWSRWIPGAFFTGFSLIALNQALSGAESCGCFGQVKVNPWITFAMDVLLAAGLWVWPPGRDPVIRWPRVGLMPRVGIVSAVAAVALGLSLWRLPRPVPAGEDGEPSGLLQAGSLTILEPGRWIGRALPLMAEIDIGQRLQSGRWVAVLHQAHCSTCREALPFYEAQARAAEGPKKNALA